MQVYSTNHPDKDPSENPEIMARFSTRRVSEPDTDSRERYIAFLTPDEVADIRKDLQFPDYAIQECINNSVQTPKVEMLEDLTYGVLNLLTNGETGMGSEEIVFFLTPTGLVIVSRPCDLIDSVKKAILSEFTSKQMLPVLPEKTLFFLFEKIIAHDVALMREIDEAETVLEEKLLAGEKLDYPVIIFRLRQKTLHLMQYMGLMVDLSDILVENNNNVIPDEADHMFHLIGTRLDRQERASVTLRESVMQLREAYQSQVDIDANLMMRLFTVVSTVFLPLMVMTSWYGMNYKFMPEISKQYGYPLFVLLAILVTIATIWYCKKKKYL
ncbi:MAG: CorA family divalent cation transporter [Eubacteriales bacterium]